jgi:Phosphoinositide phospholipase C, Ca2+-dependent
LAAPQHDPIFVTLCVKSRGRVTSFPGEIDSYIAEWFDSDLLVTPGQLMQQRGASTLGQAVARGWPDQSTVQGKFILCISGNAIWKEFYAETGDVRGRLCFADVDVSDNLASFNSGLFEFRVIANINLFSAHAKRWKVLIPLLRQKQILVRTYVLNSLSLWNAALDAGANILATDKVSNQPWATVGSGPFRISA